MVYICGSLPPACGCRDMEQCRRPSAWPGRYICASSGRLRRRFAGWNTEINSISKCSCSCAPIRPTKLSLVKKSTEVNYRRYITHKLLVRHQREFFFWIVWSEVSDYLIMILAHFKKNSCVISSQSNWFCRFHEWLEANLITSFCLFNYLIVWKRGAINPKNDYKTRLLALEMYI